MLQTQAPYREKIRQRAQELTVLFPDGFCFVEAVANESKDTKAWAKAGARTQVRVFDAAKLEIDGVARVVMPEPAAVAPAVEVQ